MTTFISYSRVNADFAVRLARDLKTAGFDVWLDQLDIPKGARWDDAIEAAVERSSAFMIVLAPESIESQNVKDELSYAIDSGKNILPVVIKPCKIPLRLRRFQYVDFTEKPYKDSLAEIKRLLSRIREPVKAPPPPPEVDEEPLGSVPVFSEFITQGQAEPALQTVKPAEPKQNPLHKFLVPIVLAIVALAAVGAGLAFAANRNVPAPATPTAELPTIPATSTFTSVPLSPQIVDRAGVTMRLVSAGPFTMGSNNGVEDETPTQTIYLDAFYIDKYEVTNAFYRACVEGGVCSPPKKADSTTKVSYYADSDYENYPAVYVDWNMAKTYCEWRGARLPAETEWEKAARGTDGRTYPWGEDISCSEANYFGCQGGIEPVSRNENGLSIYGVYNMAGNVYEWVNSLYLPYPYDPDDGREDPNRPGPRVLRGGSWLSADTDNEVRSARRAMADPWTASDSIGFRCVRTADGSESETTLVTMTPRNSITATSLAVTYQAAKTREADDSPTFMNPVTGPVTPVGTSLTTGPSAGLTPATPTVKEPSPVTVTPKTPTEAATEPPTDVPTDVPTEVPTDVPTEVPTDVPIDVPTDVPTDAPPTEAGP